MNSIGSDKVQPKTEDDNTIVSENDSISVSRPAIQKPHAHDILCGRGNAVNRHPGNVFFRKIVSHRKPDYRRGAYPYQRRKVAWEIHQEIKNLSPPGRFLMSQGVDWFEVSEAKAISKISQALRELASNDPVLPSSNSSDGASGYSSPSLAKISSGKDKEKDAERESISKEIGDFSSNVSVPSLVSSSKENVSSNASYLHLFEEAKRSMGQAQVSLIPATSQSYDKHTSKEDSESESHSSVLKEAEFLQMLKYESARLPSAVSDNIRLNAAISLANELHRKSPQVQNPSSANDAKFHLKGTKINSEELPKQNHSSALLKEDYGNDGHSSKRINAKVSTSPLETLTKNHSSKKRMSKEPSSTRKPKVQKKAMNHHSQVILPLSYIGKSFTNTACSEESKYVFEEIASLGQRENALLYLPSIIGSLCKRVVELEQEDS